MPEARVPRRAATSHPTDVPEPFECSLHGDGFDTVWVTSRGELDLATTPQLDHALNQALQRAPLVIIDLRHLTFIDSSGIRAILSAEETARRTGQRLVLIHNSGPVGCLLALLGLTARLKIVDLTADTTDRWAEFIGPSAAGADSW